MKNQPTPGQYHLPTVLPAGPWSKEYAQLLWPLNKLTLEVPTERVKAYHLEWAARPMVPPLQWMLAYMLGSLPVVPVIVSQAWMVQAQPAPAPPEIGMDFYLPDIFAN